MKRFASFVKVHFPLEHNQPLRELAEFLLCLKKRTRDDVGVVQVQRDLLSLYPSSEIEGVFFFFPFCVEIF